MTDKAHALTDREIERMERHLSVIYRRAEKELTEKAEKYFARFAELDAKKRELVDAGKLTEKEYKRWRQNKIMTGKHWTTLKEQTAQDLLNVNRTAQAYINDQLPKIYSINYNGVGEAVESAVTGYSFELVDAATVKHLTTSDKTLLPYKYVDGKKDVRWNTQKVNSEIMQGIIQGESIPKMAKRLQNVTEMNRVSAIRNARTTATSAENKGRIDMLHEARDKGVEMEKIWKATSDTRTRDSHAALDGESVGIDEEFGNGLMYPGDPNGDPSEVYNCRCTLTYKVVGFGQKTAIDVLQEKELLFETKTASDIISANEYGTQTLGNIYDQHNKENGLNRVGFFEANKLTQTVGANYGNLSVETANVFNQQIARLANKYDTPLQKVRTMTKQEAITARNTFARVSHNYSVDSAEMLINPVKCRDVAALTERITELQKRGYCVKIQAGRESEYIVTHEFGHSILNMESPLSKNWVKADFGAVKSARAEIELIYTEYITEVSHVESAFKKAEFDFITGSGTSEKALALKKELESIKLSTYSLSNADEFLAEAFTNQEIGATSNPYAEKAVSVLKKYFGR